MSLHVTCQCGERVPVSPGMAGTEVRCRCGCDIPVPRLVELRRQAAADARDLETVERWFGIPRALGIAGVLLGAAAILALVTVRSDGPQGPEANVQDVPAESGRPRPETRANDLAPLVEGGGTRVERVPLAGDPRAQMPESLVRDLSGKAEDPGRAAEGPAGPVEDPAATFGEFCSTCHVLPTPDLEPRRLWPGKIRQMYRYARGPRPVPTGQIPPIEAAIHYWASLAPESLWMPAEAYASPPSEQVFRRHLISLDVIPSLSAISCVSFVRLGDEGPPQLLLSDMAHGLVVLWAPSDPPQRARVLARIAHPSRTHVADLDGDGLRDVLVANLGDFWPVDTTEGSVVWLRNRGQGEFEQVVLIGGLGRVNEVQTADFDSDGDLDLVVGVFGNLTTGRVLYLENCTEDYDDPDFESLTLDYGTGASDVPVVDLNGDGHPDFVMLQSQEKEHVIAFLNRGWGSFRTEKIYQAPHPRWGSTGIRLTDLDGDGDVDVLLNHGDAFQFPPIPRPYHGVSWLENRGSFPFTYHRLAHLPGAQTSLPADLDGDGDLDVVSSAFIPGFDPAWPESEMMDTIVWLQQTSAGQFKRFSLETRLPFHACGDVGDYDGDGDVDIVLGNFFMLGLENVPWKACITLLENQLATPIRAPKRVLPAK